MHKWLQGDFRPNHQAHRRCAVYKVSNYADLILCCVLGEPLITCPRRQQQKGVGSHVIWLRSLHTFLQSHHHPPLIQTFHHPIVFCFICLLQLLILILYQMPDCCHFSGLVASVGWIPASCYQSNYWYYNCICSRVLLHVIKSVPPSLLPTIAFPASTLPSTLCWLRVEAPTGIAIAALGFWQHQKKVVLREFIGCCKPDRGLVIKLSLLGNTGELLPRCAS